MDPFTMALISAAIKTIADIVSQLGQGTITDEQAQAYLKASADHFNASAAAWKAAGGANG